MSFCLSVSICLSLYACLSCFIWFRLICGCPVFGDWFGICISHMCHCEHHILAHLCVQHSKYWRWQAPLTDLSLDTALDNTSRLKWSVFVYLYMWHCEHHTPAHLRVQHSKYWRCQAPLTDSVFRYCTGQTQASTGDQMSTTSHHPTSVKLMSLCRPEVLSFCVSKDWSTHQSSVCRCCLGYRPSWQCMLT